MIALGRPARAGTVLALIIASGASAQELRVTGRAQTDAIVYFESTDAAGHNGRNEIRAEVDGRAVFGRPLTLFSSVEVRADFADHDRDRIYVEEAYATSGTRRSISGLAGRSSPGARQTW